MGNAGSDLETYRSGYAGAMSNHKGMQDNVLFYRNELRSRPRGARIEDMLRDWAGDYALLEEHHGYIQWLFPLPEMGMNRDSQELQRHEMEAIRDDPVLRDRAERAFRMMLRFYGVELRREEPDGRPSYARSPEWGARFRNLARRAHNFLRITRILKFLGLVGLEELKAPLLWFFVEQLRSSDAGRLLAPILASLPVYWVGTVRDDAERARLEAAVAELTGQLKRQHQDRGGAAGVPPKRPPLGLGGAAPAGAPEARPATDEGDEGAQGLALDEERERTDGEDTAGTASSPAPPLPEDGLPRGLDAADSAAESIDLDRAPSPPNGVEGGEGAVDSA